MHPAPLIATEKKISASNLNGDSWGVTNVYKINFSGEGNFKLRGSSTLFSKLFTIILRALKIWGYVKIKFNCDFIAWKFLNWCIKNEW